MKEFFYFYNWDFASPASRCVGTAQAVRCVGCGRLTLTKQGLGFGCSHCNPGGPLEVVV